jgi:hypothetical protein
MHEDVVTRLFAKSSVGDAALWFKNLEAGSIGSWAELFGAFSRYWGEKKSLDQYLAKFYDLKRGEDEALAIFNMRFYNFYCSMPLNIRPPEAAARLCYVTTLHPNFSLLLLERRSTTLQQMFIDAQEVEDNLKACGNFLDQVKDEEWNADITDSKHEQEGCHEEELAEQSVEEQDVISYFVSCDIHEAFCLPLYDEYNNYDEVDFQKISEISFHPEKDSFQQSYENIQPIYDSYDLYHSENCDLVGGKSFPLCFSSFNILKEKFEVSYRAERVELQNHTSFLEH